MIFSPLSIEKLNLFSILMSDTKYYNMSFVTADHFKVQVAMQAFSSTIREIPIVFFYLCLNIAIYCLQLIKTTIRVTRFFFMGDVKILF